MINNKNNQAKKRSCRVSAAAIAAMAIMAMTATLLPGMTTAVAMDAMTAAELEGLSGRAGISIGTASTIRTEFSITAMSIGDGDGIGVGLGTSLPGWLKLSGVGGARGSWYIEIPAGARLSVDVDTAGAGGFTPGPPYGTIQIPADTSFLTLGLTRYTLGFDVPYTKIYVSLDPAAGNISGPGASTGWITIQDLKFDKHDSLDESVMHIWAR